MRKDLLINSLGIGGGQAVVLLATPFLARIYSPREFGEYAAVVAAAGVIATISSLRFDTALPAVPEVDVKPLFHAALVLPIFISFSVVLAFSMIGEYVTSIDQMIITSLPWIVLIAASLGAANVCQANFIRAGEFKRVAGMKILQPSIFAIVALSAVSGLNGALAVSWLIVLLWALWMCRHSLLPLDGHRSWAAAKNARKYPLLSTPMALLDTASLAMPLIYIATVFGNENAGNYSQVQRLLAAPLILLGIAAAQVFYKFAGDAHRSGRVIEPLMWRLIFSLLGLAILLVFATLLAGETMMTLMLGEGWRTDTNFLLLAIAPVIFRMVVSPVSSVFLITNRLGLGSAWQASYFIVTVGVMFLAHERLGLESYLLVLACTELAMYLLYLLLAIIAVRNDTVTSCVKDH